jgi:hypothetical protein
MYCVCGVILLLAGQTYQLSFGTLSASFKWCSTTNTQNIDQIRREPSDSRSTDTRVPNIHFSERIISFIGPFNFLKAILLNKLTKIALSSLAVLHLI